MKAVMSIFFVPIAAICSHAFAEVFVGPFNPDAGFWTPVSGGSFEALSSGSLPVRSDYALTGSYYLFTSSGSSGMADVSSAAAFEGAKGVHVMPGTFSGPGIALTLGEVVPVVAGSRYVLSAFVRIPNTTGLGTVALDLWDAPGDIAVVASRETDQWQFVYGAFTALTGVVGARATLDGNVSPLDAFYVDQLAITPESQFLVPVAVPEHPNFASFAVGISLATVVGLRRLFRDNV